MCQEKWNQIYNLLFKCTQQTRLQLLQTKLLHRVSATKIYVCSCNLINSTQRSFYGQLPESIGHVFSECYRIKELWGIIKCFLKDLQLNLRFDYKSTLFDK